MKPLTVLHVNSEPSWRGGEAQTLMLASGLRQRGHRCLLAVLRGSALEQAARNASLETTALSMKGEFDPVSVLGLASILRDERVDVLHYHTSHAVTLGTLASLIAGRRPAILTRRVSFTLRRNPLAKLKYTFRIDHIIAVAEGVRWVLIAEGIEPNRVSVVHSGIDLSRFERMPAKEDARRVLGLASGRFLVGAVGHLASHKGHSLLLAAAASLAEDLPELDLMIVGEGAEMARLESQAAGGPLAGRVTFTGFRDDVPRLMAALDLFVLPSLSGEGSPAVVKEAMASGVPIVATDLDGVREIVEEGREALLVPAGDPVRLAQAIRRAAVDEPMRAALAAAARARVQQFSSDRMVERVIEVYRQVGARVDGARGA